jgi:hypothetical protein
MTVLIITVFASCSFPKCDCIEASSDMIQTVYFNNFNQSDLDSIVLTSYNLNSNFTSLVNSYTIHGYKYDTLKFYAQTQPLNIKLDYKLNPHERIGFAELSAKWRIGSPLLAAESTSIKNLP